MEVCGPDIVGVQPWSCVFISSNLVKGLHVYSQEAVLDWMLHVSDDVYTKITGPRTSRLDNLHESYKRSKFRASCLDGCVELMVVVHMRTRAQAFSQRVTT